jgi:HEAT repeat protein
MAQYQRNLSELLHAYEDHLLSHVSTVQILGDRTKRELKDVFVELSLVDESDPLQHPELMRMMDSAMQRRVNPFLKDADTYEISPSAESENKRRIRPADLLRHGTKAIIIGAPGCGKTTLLKYLALQALERHPWLIVWLELKTIYGDLFREAEKVAARNGNLVLEELWLKHLNARLPAHDAEIIELREYWRRKFIASEIAVFLDGFDEIQDNSIADRLTNSIGEFASASYHNKLLISTRSYAEHSLGRERLQKYEIVPLSQRQVEAFLNCYYPNDPATESLLRTLQQRPSLKDVLRVPLLLGIVLRLHKQNQSIEDRLLLYDSIVADLVKQQDPEKSVPWRFHIADVELRLEFLEFLAFERLLRGGIDESEPQIGRFVFTLKILEEKAQKFLIKKRLDNKYHARDLAQDAVATPLLREIGAYTYAFAHLILQEFLAACAFIEFYKTRRNRFEGLRILCRAYHNPTIVEMEVLPMILGKIAEGDKLYVEIETWPDSLNFANLRLRARGLTYSAKLDEKRLSDLVERVFDFIVGKVRHESAYRKIVIDSCIGMNKAALVAFEDKAKGLIRSEGDLVSQCTALARIGSHRGLYALILYLNEGGRDSKVVDTLGQVGAEMAVKALVTILIGDSDQRWRAADALGVIGTERAIEALSLVFEDEAGDNRWRAAVALARLGSETVVDSLVAALLAPDSETRRNAVRALESAAPEGAVVALIASLEDEDSEVRHRSVSALGSIGLEIVVDSLIPFLNDEDPELRRLAAQALGNIGSPKGIDALVSMLNDKKNDSRWEAANALGEIGTERSVDALISAMNEDDYIVHSRIVDALGRIATNRAIAALNSALVSDKKWVRWNAAYALRMTGSEKAVDVLIEAFNDDEYLTAKRTGCDGLSIDERMAREGPRPPLSAELTADILSTIFDEESLDIETRLDYLSRADRLPWDEQSYARADAIHALGYLGSERALDVLLSALGGGRETAVAAEGLGRIGSEKAVSALISTLNDYGNRSRYAAKALAQLSPSALIKGLDRALEDNDAFVRLKAATIAGYYSTSPKLLDRLEDLTQSDEDADVRLTAQEAAQKVKRKLELAGFGSPAGEQLLESDNESRESILIGEVTKIVAQAGHIFRRTANSDWGVDGEIEFKNELGNASGQRVYLQLKSGDSYLRRRRDGTEVFAMKNRRHAEYWQSHSSPVLLVIRDSSGRIRWINVTEYLQDHGTHIKHIDFTGEPFTVESVREMRERLNS